MRMVDLIIAKRTGAEHADEELEFIVNGVATDAIPDYQITAWLMAVCLRGMSLREAAKLTDLMAKSGTILDLSEVGPYVIDKHSTGGVGDKTTLVFVPLVAAAEVPVAMLSGRGLGHTHGTLDKLEAIPGFKTNLSTKHFKDQLKRIGMAIGAQTKEFAPVDGKLYALRDVTGTVESIPLIAASVLSKKIAAGANVIVIDVKAGSGAFMRTDAQALELAETLHAIGAKLNRAITCIVTDMNQPLGTAVGHSLEVIETIETLKGRGPSDLVELCLILGALALTKAKRAKDEIEAREILSDLLRSGAALEKFKQLIEAQGGDARVIDDYSLLPQAPTKHAVVSQHQNGSHLWVKGINGRKVSSACELMGAGRVKKGEPIDLAVGVELNTKVGDQVISGKPIATIYGTSAEQCRLAAVELELAYSFSEEPVVRSKLIKQTLI
jgi:pyrimidine-nucleoside phosphorylase